MEVFHYSGTYTKPAGLKGVKVTVTGAGGSAGIFPYSSQRTGGSAGGTAIKYIPASSLSSTTTVTVGTDQYVSYNSNNNRSGGGPSSFGSHCTGNGGNHGGNLNSNGGGATGGDINLEGGTAGNAEYAVTGGYSPLPATVGGRSYWGGKTYNGAGVSPMAPSSYSRNHALHRSIGNGGDGFSTTNTSTGGIYFYGAQGIVVVEEFF
jgi:hypothetical protein